MTNQKNFWNQWKQWPALCSLLSMALVPMALATDPLYENDSALTYTIPPDFLPNIDAVNFDNEDSLTFNFESTTVNPETFRTWNTRNFTNNGLMVANSPFGIISGIFLTFTPGCGFEFDTQTTNIIPTQVANSFYNPGTIRANSFQDIGNNFFLVSTIGKCIVNATNVVVPGTIDVGDSGLIQLTGRSMDLTRSTLTVEDFNSQILGNVGLNGIDYGVGTDTNADWDPSIVLQPTFAISSKFNSLLFPPPGFNQMAVSPSIPYYSTAGSGPNYNLVRAVFINTNPGPNVTASIYFGGNPDPPLGPGFVTVGWAGAYTDPITGQPATNYLYLNDIYVRGANTNNPVINGIPANFTFTELTTPAAFGVLPATPNYPFIPAGIVTNNYSYVDAQLTAATVGVTIVTNGPGVSGITNYLKQSLPGRIEINGNDLDLSLAHLQGQNYMSLRVTNQFNGSAGAQIFSPYSDINISVTNGDLTASNLLEANLPVWNGTVQAWSSDWITVDTFGVTNEFRVILINANLNPTTPSQVQDLNFHATNNLIVSDVFNILRSFSADARNLTLTTNAPGSTSPDGELNMQALPVSGPYAFSIQKIFPSLHNLTNSGAIRMANVNPINFGSAASPYGAFINHGIITELAGNLFVDNFENDGSISNAPPFGSFKVISQTTTLTNGRIYAGGDISITADTLLASNVFLRANRSLTLTATNLLTDDGTTNGNIWIVGTNATSSFGGINLPIKPVSGDLLGTIITNYAPISVKVSQTWAGEDRGRSATGYTNNAAIGNLILKSLGAAPASQFYFSGTGAKNAIYVDRLDLQGNSDYSSRSGTTIPGLAFNTNLVIYYADAVSDGADVSAKINNFNSGHLQWVPTYTGYFSSTNLVFAGQTNAFNLPLVQNSQIDSDGDGTPNSGDPTPLFLPGNQNIQMTPTNGNTVMLITWDSIPDATNHVVYSTDLINWIDLTNFVSPSQTPPAGGWPIKYVVAAPYSNPFYIQQPIVTPDSTDVYGPGF